MGDEDYISLVRDNNAKFWSILPTDWATSDQTQVTISKIESNPEQGTVKLEIRTNYVIDASGANKVIADAGQYIGGQVTLTGFQEQQPTSWNEANVGAATIDVTNSAYTTPTSFSIMLISTLNNSFTSLNAFKVSLLNLFPVNEKGILFSRTDFFTNILNAVDMLMPISSHKDSNSFFKSRSILILILVDLLFMIILLII